MDCGTAAMHGGNALWHCGNAAMRQCGNASWNIISGMPVLVHVFQPMCCGVKVCGVDLKKASVSDHGYFIVNVFTIIKTSNYPCVIHANLLQGLYMHSVALSSEAKTPGRFAFNRSPLLTSE